MRDAPNGKEFVFHDGKTIKNVSELADYLNSSGRSIFHTFVNSNKNDFANWIEYVLEDKTLSNSLRQTSNFDETIKILQDSLKPSLAPQNISNITASTTSTTPIPSRNDSVSSVNNSSVNSSPEVNIHKSHLLNIPSNDGPYSESEINKYDTSDKKKNDSSKNWFKFAQKKIEERKESHEQKENTHQNNKHENSENETERIVWTILYVLIVVIIIFLVVYKFVLV
jgi:hypothetical protein